MLVCYPKVLEVGVRVVLMRLISVMTTDDGSGVGWGRKKRIESMDRRAIRIKGPEAHMRSTKVISIVHPHPYPHSYPLI